MKNLIPLMLFVALTGFSCSATAPSIFSKKTPHEAYASRLDKQDLDETPAGKQWLQAAELALQLPTPVELPYSQLGHFPVDKARALGLRFDGKPGQKIQVELTLKGKQPFVLYADLYRMQATGVDHLLAADTLANGFSYDMDGGGTYILRLQPELFRTGAYELKITTGPSLGFPVAGKANIGSVWGDARDGGQRSHEGIDIFAKKGAPAVAAANGVVTGIREGGIGGKTIWLRPEGKNYTLYYAHLDAQLVQEGQRVNKGDTIGLVGNTGNAQFTPPHLHFGIYGFGGAVDPILYVQKKESSAPPIPKRELTTAIKLKKARKDETGTLLEANTTLVPLGISKDGYLAEFPNGTVQFLPFSSVRT